LISISLSFRKELPGLLDQPSKLSIRDFLDWPIRRVGLPPLWQYGHDQPQILQRVALPNLLDYLSPVLVIVSSE
jgi:hypothetical protein